jgi:VanZ family protein
MNQRSSAWPLALVFTLLVFYASLYPFEGWRFQGAQPLHFLAEPWPRYWTRFDVVANALGYAPLGFLIALGMLRSGAGRWSWPVAAGLPALLSLVIESVQTYLPMRVPSNLDLVLNAGGALVGATAAVWLERMGGLRRWSRFRADWLVPRAQGSLVLLALWPVALLYPVSVPFGLGQVWTRVELGLVRLFDGTPFLAWLPVRPSPPAPLSLLAEAFCVGLALLTPLLMGYADVRTVWRRAVFLSLFFACALGTAALSSALTFGPAQAWAWLTPQAELGLLTALIVGLLALGLPERWCQLLMLLCLASCLTLLNSAPDSPYFEESLHLWEQGRFIRFHGLSQWLGWIWPFAALWVGLRALARPPTPAAA